MRGFTLIEMLLSVAVIAIISAISTPFLLSFYNDNDLDLCAQNVVLNMRMAQSQARAGANNGHWGVELATSTITLFQGDSFAVRDSSFDSQFVCSTELSFSGGSEYIFEKISGKMISTATNTIISSPNDNRILLINSEGMINY